MKNGDHTQKINNNSNEQIFSSKNIVVDLLYLDLSVCTRCQDTESSLDDSLSDVVTLLENIGKKIQLNKIHIETKEQAIKHHFLSSPTIRVNGRDIQMEVKENHCSTCSSLTSGASVDCRLWIYNDKKYTVPPKEMIIDEILKEIYSPKNSDSLEVQTEHVLPKNLVEYFAKKDQLCANVSSSSSDNSDSCCESDNCCS